MNDFFLILFILLFFQIKSFNFYLSMFVEEADDCISQIYYNDNNPSNNFMPRNIYRKENSVLYMIISFFTELFWNN